MDAYYDSQRNFHGPARQFRSGAGLGAFAVRVGRTAMPLLKKYVAPIIKQVGQNVLEAAVPEVVSLISGKKKMKRAIKDGAKRAIAKNFEPSVAAGGTAGGGRAGGGRAGGGGTRKRKHAELLKAGASSTKTIISSKKTPKRSRADILTKVRFDNSSNS